MFYLSRYTALTLLPTIPCLGRNNVSSQVQEGMALNIVHIFYLFPELRINADPKIMTCFPSYSAFMIGDGKLLTNAHCVEHGTQVNTFNVLVKIMYLGAKCIVMQSNFLMNKIIKAMKQKFIKYIFLYTKCECQLWVILSILESILMLGADSLS